MKLPVELEAIYTEAAFLLIQEWDKPIWSGDLTKQVQDLAREIAERGGIMGIDPEVLLERAKFLDPSVGKHFIQLEPQRK